MFGNLVPLSVSSQRHKRIMESLSYMVVADCLPFNIVEGDGFVNFVKALEPRFRLPHRKTLTKVVDDKFELIKESMCKQMAEIEWISLTTDIWTDTLNQQSYIALTAHFIREFSHHSITLAVEPMVVTHTADNIQHAIDSILKDWKIEREKIVACVTDGGSNVVKAAQTLFGKSLHLHCFAHLLNLTAQQAIKATIILSRMVKNVKDIVTYFKQSTKAADKLREMQLREGEITFKVNNNFSFSFKFQIQP